MNLRRRHCAGLAAFVATIGTLTFVATPVAAVGEPPAPASGHAEVIAQGLVEFDGSPVHWQLTPTPVTTTPTSLPTSDPAFLLTVGEGAVLASDESGPLARLATGEAMFRGAGTPTDLVTLAAAPSIVDEIAIVAGSGTDEFTVEPGVHDVDLVRDVLATNEALVLRADVSAFVVVTQGNVSASGTPIAAGSAVSLSGDITLINTAAEVAMVAVAVVGPVVDPSATPAPGPAPVPDSPDSPDIPTEPTSPGTPTTTTDNSATTTTTEATTTTTTTTAEPVDTDSDGLSDTEEASLGTDPNNQDSDIDGIPDGREVNSLGSNPLDADTDSDGLTDALEVDHSCDINAPDTDDDNLGDAFEANSGFSECSLEDTDGDGDRDGDEFSCGSDPRNPQQDASVCPHRDQPLMRSYDLAR